MIFIHLDADGREPRRQGRRHQAQLSPARLAPSRDADRDARVPERAERDARRAVPLGARDGRALRDVQHVPRPARRDDADHVPRVRGESAARRSATHAASWNATREDPDIAADIALIDHYIANLQAVGGYRPVRRPTDRRLDAGYGPPAGARCCRRYACSAGGRPAGSRSSGSRSWRCAAAGGINGSMFDPAVFAARRDAYMQAIGPTGVAVVQLAPGAAAQRRRVPPVPPALGSLLPHRLRRARHDAGPAAGRRDRARRDVRAAARSRDGDLGRPARRHRGREDAATAPTPRTRSPSCTAKLSELIANGDELHYSLGLDDEMDELVTRTIARLRKTEKRGKRPPRAVVDPRDRAARAAPAQAARGARGAAHAPPRSPPRRTSPRCGRAARACASTSSRR